ncbi:molybdopterin biosynthesis protein [Methanosarcinales archaeon ex4572_44]|nr:MAG: molybdopterin biosynthesis protein [Methanosarcinales archaeon ex4572_44]
MRKEFRGLISAREAREIIAKIPLETRNTEVPLEEASGRILAEDITTTIDVPPFDRASMDGYALQAEDTYQAREDIPVKLHVIDAVHPGRISEREIESGEAIEVGTGAPMPKGADAVVMVEDTEDAAEDDFVAIKKPVAINANTMHAGTDMMVGERVLRAGTQLTPREIGVLAAIGKREIMVKTLVAGVISTGDELTPPGEPLPQAHIYDTNTYTIKAALTECGATPIVYPITPDKRELMTKAIRRATDECDLVLTSGSTSAGSSDIIYQIIADEGDLNFHGINIKPGKPAMLGILNKTPIIGLPGYPTSALTIFNQFIAEKIQTSLSQTTTPNTTTARLATTIRTSGREELLPVIIARKNAYPADKGSGAITTLAHADGFIHIPPTTEMVDAGTRVEVRLFSQIATRDILFIGSHCPGIDVVEDLIPYTMRIINTGSTGGIIAIRNRHADIAGTHLLDSDGNYNEKEIKRYKIKDAVLIKGYLREQGIITNDEKIKGVRDLVGKTIMNRNNGSGTRTLTDLLIQKAALEDGTKPEEIIKKIKGYHTQAKTHSAVASAVKLGRADAGFGIKPAATHNNLHFIKVADEEYDLLTTREFINTPEAGSIIQTLKSKKFKETLPEGITTYKRSGEAIEL